MYYCIDNSTLENVPAIHRCPFTSYGPTGEVSLLYHVYFARYGPKPRTKPKFDGRVDRVTLSHPNLWAGHNNLNSILEHQLNHQSQL